MIQVLDIFEGCDVFSKSFTGNSRQNSLKLLGRGLVPVRGKPKASAFKKQQLFFQSVGLVNRKVVDRARFLAFRDQAEAWGRAELGALPSVQTLRISKRRTVWESCHGEI